MLHGALAACWVVCVRCRILLQKGQQLHQQPAPLPVAAAAAAGKKQQHISHID
jgi:hypothetical protein